MEFQMETIQKYQNGEMELKDAQMAIENYWGGALRRAVIDGDVENGSLMAGQSVGLVKEEKSVQAVIDELAADAAGALRRLSNIPA